MTQNYEINVATALKKANKNSSLVKELTNTGVYFPDGTELILDSSKPVFKDYDLRSDATLKKEAVDYVDKSYQPKIDATNLSADKKIGDLNDKLTSVALSNKSDKSKIISDYNKTSQNITEKVIKNGTDNSSIYSGLLDNAKNNFNYSLDILKQEYDIKYAGIQREIEYTEEQRKIALTDYDLKKAVEYDKKLNELRLQQKEYNLEVSDYNEKLREWLQSYEENKQRTIEEWQRAIAEGKI